MRQREKKQTHCKTEAWKFDLEIHFAGYLACRKKGGGGGEEELYTKEDTDFTKE